MLGNTFFALKDTMMLAGSWIIGIDAAKAILAGDQKR